MPRIPRATTEAKARASACAAGVACPLGAALLVREAATTFALGGSEQRILHRMLLTGWRPSPRRRAHRRAVCILLDAGVVSPSDLLGHLVGHPLGGWTLAGAVARRTRAARAVGQVSP